MINLGIRRGYLKLSTAQIRERRSQTGLLPGLVGAAARHRRGVGAGNNRAGAVGRRLVGSAHALRLLLAAVTMVLVSACEQGPGTPGPRGPQAPSGGTRRKQTAGVANRGCGPVGAPVLQCSIYFRCDIDRFHRMRTSHARCRV